jgi:hypothetical protein
MKKQPDLHLSRVYAVTVIVLAALALLLWVGLQPLID